MIESVLINNQYFECTVYYRPKKVEQNKVDFRPLHTADLVTQVAIVSILNGILLDKDEEKETVNLSELARIIPKNFYGNIPSNSPNQLFIPWQQQYRKYSNDITESYIRFFETKEYKHEITLDLINFFPSVNPMLIYEKVLKLFGYKYKGREYECLKKVLIKLLFLKVNNAEDMLNVYYEDKFDKDNYSGIYFNQGIPQGLPQAYLFGNIAMIEVSKIFDSTFKGKSYYYVDDSVIYTNAFKNTENLPEAFEKKIKDLNNKLENYSKNLDQTIFSEMENIAEKYLREYIKFDNYCIEVHGSDSKSEATSINQLKQEQAYLNFLSKEASLGALELKTVFTDEEDEILRNKFSAILISIEKEINLVNESSTEDEKYIKRLNRFKKFFKFRIRLIEYKKNNLIKKEQIEFIRKSLKVSSIGSIEERTKSFFNAYDEDTFLVELMYVLKNCNDEKILNLIKKAIKTFDSLIFQDNISRYSYFQKICENINYQTEIFKREKDKYETLTNIINLKLPSFFNTYYQYRREILEKVFKDIKTQGIREWSMKLDENFSKNGLYFWVTIQTDEQYRMLLNTYFSKITNVILNDKYRVSWKHRKPIVYSEFRILLLIRNLNFNVEAFITKGHKVIMNRPNQIDYSIMEVVEYFKTFVKDPNMIDNLILIHKYTSEMWKNGSKFLHFYTLHNQEHAVELIKAISTVVKSIDYIQITSFDYYILFIACYLHDISMVLHPDLKKIFNGDNIESNIVFSEFRASMMNFKEKLYLVDSKDIKDILIEYYKKIDSFFETIVRSNHARESASFIRQSNDLTFIDNNIRDLVAEISEAHGFETSEIYGIKSNAKNTLISKKYLKILLRLADLLDMSENRIAPPILKNNETYMSKTTVFHWLSHKAIAGYELQTRYVNISKKNPTSFLNKGAIEEELILVVYLNSKYNLNTRKLECKSISYDNSYNEKHGFKLKIDNQKVNCGASYCHFMCKWMAKKNEYLYCELEALNQYLKRANSDLFTTQISIEYKFTDTASMLTNEEYENLNRYLNV